MWFYHFFFSLTCIYEIGIILYVMKKYENLAKTIYDIGKLSFATLILGQFVSHKFSLLVTIFGILLTGSAFFIAFKIEQRDDK